MTKNTIRKKITKNKKNQALNAHVIFMTDLSDHDN